MRPSPERDSNTEKLSVCVAETRLISFPSNLRVSLSSCTLYSLAASMLNCNLHFFFPAPCEIPPNPHICVSLESRVIHHAPENVALVSAVIGAFCRSVTLRRPNAVMNSLSHKVMEVTFTISLDPSCCSPSWLCQVSGGRDGGFLKPE